ncbi:hypothetical protein EEB12_15495 [Rhodococcus sp. WS1]|nr:hypothetical protein EEB12_15495 [Rhodococcus sp. WS1]TQC38161.1 hypothetical protein EEB16_11930 [Rhodococcus sp. WS7]
MPTSSGCSKSAPRLCAWSQPTRPHSRFIRHNQLKAIHRALFQDVYDWAGEERTGPPSEMRKSAAPPSAITRQAILAPMVNYGYYPAPAMPDAANLQFRRLAKHDRLRGRNREEFPPVSPNTGEKSTPSTTKIISSQFIGDAVCTRSSCRGQCRRRTTMSLILVSVRRPSTCPTGGL